MFWNNNKNISNLKSLVLKLPHTKKQCLLQNATRWKKHYRLLSYKLTNCWSVLYLRSGSWRIVLLRTCPNGLSIMTIPRNSFGNVRTALVQNAQSKRWRIRAWKQLKNTWSKIQTKVALTHFETIMASDRLSNFNYDKLGFRRIECVKNHIYRCKNGQ